MAAAVCRTPRGHQSTHDAAGPEIWRRKRREVRSLPPLRGKELRSLTLNLLIFIEMAERERDTVGVSGSFLFLAAGSSGGGQDLPGAKFVRGGDRPGGGAALLVLHEQDERLQRPVHVSRHPLLLSSRGQPAVHIASFANWGNSRRVGHSTTRVHN